jgi:DNA-directed RNA polymerase subunit RPC12/RpoP
MVVAQVLPAADAGSSIFGFLIVAAIILGILGYFARTMTDVVTTFTPGKTSTGGRCPFCGKSIKAGMYTCHHCGRDKRSEVRNRNVKCPSCQRRVRVKGAMGQTFVCPHCQQSATLTS